MAFKCIRGFKRIYKTLTPDPYIQVNKDSKPHVTRTMADLKKESRRYTMENSGRKRRPDFKPIPVSPTLDPILVTKPKIGEKIKWCSCGMSRGQPYCDNSHVNTAFKPIEFEIQEPVFDVLYCGCKYSKQAPFCDMQTCKTLRDQETLKLEQFKNNTEDKVVQSKVCQAPKAKKAHKPKVKQEEPVNPAKRIKADSLKA